MLAPLICPAVLVQLFFCCRRTVHDKQTGSDLILSDEQLELVNRLQKGQFGDINFNEYEVRSVQTPHFEREQCLL